MLIESWLIKVRILFLIKRMKPSLILLTALYRFDNLLLLAKIVKKYVYDYSHFLDIHWLICKDAYNGVGNLDEFFEYISQPEQQNINWTMYDSGTPAKENYGGALFNIPLQDYVENFKNLNNPWIYILDDDNILHPNIFETLKIFIYENRNEEVILLNCRFDEGFVRMFNKDNLNIPGRSGWIEGIHMADPSCVIMKYNIIKKHGFVSDEFYYDFHWLGELINKELSENNIFTAQELVVYLDKFYFAEVVNSYHNHLNFIKDDKKINEIEEKGLNNICIDINFISKYTKSIFKTANFPILSTKAKEKIINIIKDEIKDLHANNDIQ